MEVAQSAKKEAKVVGRPIDPQLLKYLLLTAAYATHGKYWEKLNGWLNDKNLNELRMEEERKEKRNLSKNTNVTKTTTQQSSTGLLYHPTV